MKREPGPERGTPVEPWYDEPTVVEGSGLAFLRGAERLIRHHRPLVILEINPTTASAAGYTISDLLDRLDGLGYRRFAEIDQYPKTISRSAVRLEPQRNLVALPSHFGRV